MHKPRLKYSILLLVLTMSYSIYGENDSLLIPYSLDFNFNNGLYFTFNQVKNNNPTPFNNIISDNIRDNSNFIEDITHQKYINYYENGRKKSIALKHIWGYARNGVLYINVNNQFFRLTSIGSISFFIANIEVEYTNPNIDPWAFNNINHYNEHYKTNEIKQFLLSFEDGSIYPFHYKNLKILLSKDTELFEEYSSLKRRKQKQLVFSFIRKYNKKHPLYLPTYQQ